MLHVLLPQSIVRQRRDRKIARRKIARPKTASRKIASAEYCQLGKLPVRKFYKLFLLNLYLLVLSILFKMHEILK